MYCVKCGVELADSEKKCPLCGTKVYYPGIEAENPEKPYPPFEISNENVNPAGLLFVVTAFFVIAEIICLLCDFNVYYEITWSGFVMGAIGLSYLLFVFPFWFKKFHPAIFIPVDFSAIALYVLYINIKTGGHWFLPFALPVIASICIIVSSVVILCRYLRKGYLYIFSGAFFANACFSVLLEVLINNVFNVRSKLVWSIYPCAAFFILGIMLLVIAIVKPLRESLRKKFFI